MKCEKYLFILFLFLFCSLYLSAQVISVDLDTWIQIEKLLKNNSEILNLLPPITTDLVTSSEMTAELLIASDQILTSSGEIIQNSTESIEDLSQSNEEVQNISSSLNVTSANLHQTNENLIASSRRSTAKTILIWTGSIIVSVVTGYAAGRIHQAVRDKR